VVDARAAANWDDAHYPGTGAWTGRLPRPS
jgi:hypothetical protein